MADALKKVPDWFKTFEREFSDGVGSCRGQCACGRQFYNPDGSWSWDEGELEQLAGQATATEYSIGYLTFEGRTYVDACDCWHARATQVGGFIKAHAEKIANFLNAERRRLVRAAESIPVVEDGSHHG